MNCNKILQNNETINIKKQMTHLGFKLNEIIGRGTYSKVYIAINNNGKKLACKIIKKNKAGEIFLKKFFPREIQILAVINHPNIIKCYQVYESNRMIYMLMDYCQNGDLFEYIQLKNALKESNAKKFFKQIVTAVNYLHKLNIAHRDLKCENIFLETNYQIKLGDFGFARYCHNKNGNRILSDTFCGSAAYAAPEVLNGMTYDPKMYDIWSLGCILYILITARMPFDDIDIHKMIKNQQSKTALKNILISPKFSITLKYLLNSLLEPNLTERITIGGVVKHQWLEDSICNTNNNSAHDDDDEIKPLISISSLI